MIVIEMKFLSLSLAVCGLLSGAQLKDVKTVYFYPMPGGLDQLLAGQIVAEHVYQVVPDPKLADAVFTDQLSDGFLYKLAHIDKPKQVAKMSGSMSSMAASEDDAPHGSTFSRAKGTIFLVDVKSRQVLWTAFEKPGSTSSPELYKVAQKLVKRLELAINPAPATH